MTSSLVTPEFSSARALDRLGLFLLGVAVLFQAVFCLPEIALGAFPVHDGTFHQALSLRLIDAVQAGENPLDSWVSFSSMGYPVWRSYQPLVHWISAAAMAVGAPFAESGSVFGFLTWLALCLHPLAFFLASRMLGVGRFGAGIAALICLAPVGVGNLNAFGVGYGSYVWTGSGLTTQMWAIPLLVLAIGAAPSALTDGGSRARAALLIGATALCHLIFGYAAAVSVAALAVLLPRRDEPEAGPRRAVRLAILGAGTASLCAFVVVPALLDGDFVNHSVWEPAWKWRSHGAPTLVGALLTGDLLDAGRVPVLTSMLAGSAVAAGFRWRSARARALLGLTLLWLLLAFGRTTWGALLPTALVNEHIHLHRFVAVFQACSVLLIGLGVDLLVRWLSTRPRWALAGAVAVILAVTPVLRERADSLRATATLGVQHRLEVQAEAGDFDSALELLDTSMQSAPGRIFAGLAARWGRQFKLGVAPAYHALGVRGLDVASHLWHSMSLPSDALLAIDDRSADHLRRFGIGYVLTDLGRAPAEGLTALGQVGRFRVWAVPEAGYFGVEARPATCAPGSSAPQRLICSKQWLSSPLPRPPGRVISEHRAGAEHDALVELDEDAVVVFRTSYHPGWTASVDGVPVATRSVVPGFLALDAPSGRHDIRLRYRPGPLKPALFVLGLLGFLGLLVAERRGPLERFERRTARRLFTGMERLRERLSRLPWPTVSEPGPVIAVVALTVLAMAPFFRGDMVLGHDAMEYPTRLAELHDSWKHGILLPVWAPDLSAGQGQPFFGFAAPVSITVAGLLHVAGLGLAASLNGAIIVLALIGALGTYGLGRRISGPAGGIVASAAFVFSGYFQVEVYVRGAAMEFSGLALLPMALLLLLRCLERPGAGRLIAASVGIAGIALSHNAVLLMAAPALTLFVGLIALARRDLHTLDRGIVAGLGGLGLSAWFWLPTLSEKQFTHVHRLLEGHTRWEGHFVYARQLLASEWGYGLSVPGPGDQMSFQVGVVLLVLAVAGLVAVTLRGGDQDPIPRALVGAAIAIACLAAAMTHWVSAPLWASVDLLQYLQFPWRFLALVSVFLPIAAAASVPLWARLDRRPSGGKVSWAVMGPALSVAALATAGLLHLSPAGTETLDEESFTPAAIAEAGRTTTTFREFEPIWVDRKPVFQADRVLVVWGLAALRTVLGEPTRQRFEIDASGPARLQLNTSWFPGWTVRVNDQVAELTWVDSGGLPQFDVPAGRSAVEARFEATPIRTASRLLSLLVFLVLAGWLVMDRRTTKPTVDLAPTGGGRSELIVAGLIAALAVLAIFVSDEPLPSTATNSALAQDEHFRLAVEHEQAGRPDLAEAEYRAALEIESSERAWVGVGLIALSDGRVAEAATAFTEATVVAPDSYPAWLDLGIARARLGEHRQALEPFARALELRPDSLDARHNLGVTWGELGDPRRSAEYLEPIVQRDPRRARSWYELGVAREALGEREAARSAFSRALQLDPTNEAARRKLEALR